MRAKGLVLALAGCLLLGLVPPAALAAPTPQVGIADIEDEVMCTICGTLLELADSPQARREKAFVRQLIREGKSRDEIKDQLVAQYGDDVLATPDGSGFNLSAYLVPALAFLAAAIALAFGVFRWRRQGEDARRGPPSAGPTDDEDARLDEDIARYDL